MNDPYPSTLNFEIDRQQLRNYLCVKWLCAWVLPLSFLGALFGLASMEKALDEGVGSRIDIILLIARCVASGMGISLIISLLGYFVFSHRMACRLAASLEVSVEGAFLRVRQHAGLLSDRKLHFRSIVDYAAIQDVLMRYFGIHALQMTTTAGGGTRSCVLIPGVKDCLKVRDVLADIDRLRERE